MELSLQEDILQNNEDRSSDEIKVEGEILTWDTLWFEVCSSGEQIKDNKETMNICSETDSSDQVICSTEIKKDDASLSIQNKNDDQNIEEITAVTTKGTSIDIPDVDLFSEAKITTEKPKVIEKQTITTKSQHLGETNQENQKDTSQNCPCNEFTDCTTCTTETSTTLIKHVKKKPQIIEIQTNTTDSQHLEERDIENQLTDEQFNKMHSTTKSKSNSENIEDSQIQQTFRLMKDQFNNLNSVTRHNIESGQSDDHDDSENVTLSVINSESNCQLKFNFQIHELSHQTERRYSNKDCQNSDKNVEGIVMNYQAIDSQSRNNDTNILEDNFTCSECGTVFIEETKQALRSVKLGKAVGIDNLPNEILRNDNLTNVLHELYNTCFCNGIVPDVWCQNIIQPLLKKGKDYRDPLSYRCISLMSTVAKVFSHILNKRLVKYIEENDLLSEEQNGFRKLRSCLDHIFTLCTILRNRKTMNMDTYLCFIDFSKAFDSVNHTLLWNKLLSNGIHGNFYRTIRNMYSKLQSVVRISRNTLTDWFSVDAGVRQGDNLAPTLFALFINSLIPEINNLHKGINIGDDMVSCLLYADDLVIMSDSADGLQSQLDSLHKWTNDHLMTVNYDKSKVMHIRKTTVNQCGHTFMFGDKALELTSKYRYLGLVICEHTDFTTTTHELLTAGSRALGSLLLKYYTMGNMDYDTYTKIYDSTVLPILEYASTVWGFKKYNP
ncbi:unnamed protein product [Mytilus edulis]|uniref:Reverse transcriptase domain-containing protein n=1 Tax=Mytilus edulis TaxID=6550 RepID=A0A8S3UB32_MYTED|nr:unnamed protein product [Mytilus edulis]